jgi:hypothetical protein
VEIAPQLALGEVLLRDASIRRFGATLKEMRKRNAARKPQEKDAQEFNQSDHNNDETA